MTYLKSNSRERISRWLDKIAFQIAWHLPIRVVYHAIVRGWVYSLSGKWGKVTVGEVRTFETAARWREQDH